LNSARAARLGKGASMSTFLNGTRVHVNPSMRVDGRFYLEVCTS
jgi:hypothetical protein